MINLPPFSSAAFLDDLRGAGVGLRLDADGRLIVRFNQITSTPALVEAIQRHRADLIRMLTDEKTPKPENTPDLKKQFEGLSDRIERRRRAEALLVAVRASGSTVTLSEGVITVRPRPSEAMAALLVASKPALLALLRAEAEAGR